MATIFQYAKQAVIELATANRRGLMGPLDFVKLQALRLASSGRAILLPPSYTSSVGEISGNGSAHLRGATGANSFFETGNSVHLTSNAYYDGTNWQRYNVALPGYVVVVGPSGLLLYDFPAGANPIAFSANSPSILVVGTPWTAPTYSANWSDWGAGEATGGYRKDNMGWVRLKGLVKKSVAVVAGDVIFTLPVGFRPVTEHIFTARSSAGSSEFRVAPNGFVYIQVDGGGAAAWTSLAQVHFDPTT